MDDSDDETTTNNCNKATNSAELEREARIRLNINSYRSVGNAAFHDGYDEGKQAVSQAAFDAGYKEAFEQHFVLSTLKGVAHALKSSYNLTHNNKPPTSTPSTSSSTPSRLSTSSSRSARGSIIFDSPTCPATGDTTGSSSISSRSSSSSSSSSTSNVNNPTAGSSNINVNISSNHLTLLESMKFDNPSDIESIKKDLIRICHENRLEILAHYISQIG